MKSDHQLRLVEIIGSMRSSLKTSGHSRVRAAMSALDPERVSSVPGILKFHGTRVTSFRADRELSDEGKRKRIQTSAESALGNLAGVAKEVAKLRAEHGIDRALALKIPRAADAPEMLLDLEYARMQREKPVAPTMLEINASERMRLALARLPTDITGLDAKAQTRLAASLVAPDRAAQFADEVEAIDGAAQAVQAAIDALAGEAQLEAREMVRLFGTEWRLPGVIDTMARRLDGEIKTEQAAAA
jgi:multidrug efflux pump subunit AcrA (membrane-fusion protein)